jgi:hypothetical protein
MFARVVCTLAWTGQSLELRVQCPMWSVTLGEGDAEAGYIHASNRPRPQKALPHAIATISCERSRTMILETALNLPETPSHGARMHALGAEMWTWKDVTKPLETPRVGRGPDQCWPKGWESRVASRTLEVVGVWGGAPATIGAVTSWLLWTLPLFGSRPAKVLGQDQRLREGRE